MEQPSYAQKLRKAFQETFVEAEVSEFRRVWINGDRTIEGCDCGRFGIMELRQW